MQQTLATKRLVGSTSIFINKKSDCTDNFELFIQTLVGYATYDGIPNRVKFEIAKNSTGHLTKENGLLDLTIPIIPACYDINSVRSLSDFVSNAKNVEDIQAKVSETNPEVLEKRIRNYTGKMVNYIINEIAKRYATARKNGDTATMELLSNLKVMKGFDLELYSMLLDMPTQIVQNKNQISTQNNQFVLVYDDGKIIPISKEQYYSINSYAHSYNRYIKDQQKFYSLSKVLSDYENYDITKELHESTVPIHSVVARETSAKSQNRVKKTKQATNSNSTTSKPKQFGEE